MKEVFVSSHNIITSLGFTTEDNVQQMLSGKPESVYTTIQPFHLNLFMLQL
ncbi:MAG: hypothetical protein HC906_07150 [Bacteroidales bacterium]|nr:hypothetical protein [Bacteroidales bacterium]